MEIEKKVNELDIKKNQKSLKDFIIYYKENKEKYQKEYNEKKEKLETIINKKWPIDKWKELELTEYYRTGHKETFCYDYEKTMKGIWQKAIPNIIKQDHLYGYKINSENKYMIENGKNYNKKYLIEDSSEKVNKEWNESRKNIYEFLIAIKDNDTNKAHEIMNREKHIYINLFFLLAYIYFPDKYVGALTKNRIKGLERTLNIESEIEDKIKSKYSDKNVLDIKKHFSELNNMIRDEFSKAGLSNENGFMITTALWDYTSSKTISSTPIVPGNGTEEDNEPEEEYCFISREEIDEIKELLEFKKNIILEGVPGVGKTYLARKIALEIVGKGHEGNIQMIQFHQNYAYEDFIEGLRPQKNGEFHDMPGFLKNICNEIEEHKEKRKEKFVIIIDEINRGNISKIFGETFMLIENNKRSRQNKKEYYIKLPYSQDEFSIPENIYFIGTMNTVDKSIALFDFALRRRFSMYDIKPCFGDERVNDEIERYLEDLNSEKLTKLWNNITEINRNFEMGDLLIGHSYLCGLERYKDNIDQKIDLIVKYEILPQLKEYFIGNTNKYEKIKELLLNGYDTEDSSEEERINDEG